jgi:hypothetical protein
MVSTSSNMFPFRSIFILGNEKKKPNGAGLGEYGGCLMCGI